MVYGTGKALAGMSVQGWLFSKERLFPNLTEVRTVCTVEKMLQPYQKTCYSTALTNKKATVYLQSVRWCSVPPPLPADLCELLYLKTIPHTADPSPSYHGFSGRKTDFFFILD